MAPNPVEPAARYPGLTRKLLRFQTPCLTRSAKLGELSLKYSQQDQHCKSLLRTCIMERLSLRLAFRCGLARMAILALPTLRLESQ